MAADHVGAAKRRRDRQFRAFRRHEQLTVRMELAAALHHSAQPAGPVVEGPSEGDVRETYEALRRLKAPLPVKRPGTVGARGAGCGSHGRARGCRSSSPGRADATRRRQRRRHHRLLPPGREPHADEERGGGEEAEVEGGREARDGYAGTGCEKVGERLSAPDDDAWHEWTSVSLGLPSLEERMSKRKRKKKRRKKLPKSCLARAPRTWKT